MKAYRVVVPEHVLSKMRRMGFNQGHRLDNLVRKLSENPYAGKRLGKDLFEKKWGPFRIFYVVIEDVAIVIIIDYTDKKHQRAAIDRMLANWSHMVGELRKLYA